MAAEFDRYSATYDRVLADALGTRGDVDRFAAYKIDEMAFRLHDAHVRHVLDFGCGVGRSLPFIAAAFPRADVWGFDPSPHCAAAAAKRDPRAHVTSNWDELPSGSFDCIVAANVFHHVDTHAREHEMRRCAALLAEAGSFFVFEHNPWNPLTRLVFERCPFDRHARMIRRGDLMKLGAQAGLRVRHAAFTLFFPFSNAVFARLQRGLAWLPLGAQYYVQFAR